MAKRSPIAIIASNVRSLRLAKEWSQGELARRAGVSQKVISNLENADKLQISPTIDTVSSVAEAFGLSMLALMTSIRRPKDG